MMNHEYIVPMTDQTREITLYPSSAYGVNAGNSPPPEGIFSTGLSTSLKPQMRFSTPCFVRSGGLEADGTGEITGTDSPEIPLDILKDLTVEMLTAGVWAVGQNVRHPVGGSFELLLVPLIKLFYNLLVLGVFGDEDLGKVLKLIEPAVFSINAETLNKEEEEDAADDDDEQCTGGNIKENVTPHQGLLQMMLPEAVKLEVKEYSDLFNVLFLIPLLFCFFR